MQITTEVIAVASGSMTFELWITILAIVGGVMIVGGLSFFIQGLTHNVMGGVWSGLAIMVIGVLVLMGCTMLMITSRQENVYDRQAAAIEQQLGYSAATVNEGVYRAIDPDGQVHEGCLGYLGGDQFILVPNGPNEDGRCIFTIEPTGTPEPEE